jgi:uroporphyrinogen decarboxylase
LSKLQYVFDAVRVIRRQLDGRVPLIGFAGSPFTVACYMVEGKGSDDYRLIKSMLYARPDLLHRILKINAETTAQYLNAQIDAGAQAVMIFDSWGGVLADGLFQQFSLHYTKQVVSALKRQSEGRTVPVIVFTKGGGQWLESIAGCGADAVGLDWTVDLAAARRRVSDSVAFQGNLDPISLFGGEPAIRQEVRRVLDNFGPVGAGGHVFNLGHGISQFTPPESVEVLVDEVRAYSPKLHGSCA